MSNPKRNPNAIGDDCSCSQRILVEQFTPKQAIAKSHPMDNCTIYDMKSLPEHMLVAIHENGLYDKYLTMQKMEFTVCRTGDPVQRVLSIINRYGVLPGVQAKMKSINVK